MADYYTYSDANTASELYDFDSKKYRKLYLIKEEINKLVKNFPFSSLKTISEIVTNNILGYRILGKIPISYEIYLEFKCTEDAFLENFSGLLLGNTGLVLVEDNGYSIYSSDPDIILEPLLDLVNEIVTINADREGLYKSRLFDSDKFWDEFDPKKIEKTLKNFSWDNLITTTTTGAGITTSTSTLTTGDACFSVVNKSNTLPVTESSNIVLSDE